MCEKHSVGATNNWTGEIIGVSNIVCDDCGTLETLYKPKCSCLGLNSVSLCINCHDEDYAMYSYIVILVVKTLFCELIYLE